jgi:catechol-2,3-dioxygenase
MNAITTTMKRPEVKTNVIDPRVRIGHVHLRVSDLERSLAFYCNVLGFELTGRLDNEAAFLSAGGYHHHIALNTWQSSITLRSSIRIVRRWQQLIGASSRMAWRSPGRATTGAVKRSTSRIPTAMVSS